MVNMKIVDEPTNYGGSVQNYPQLTNEATLKTRFLPSNFSGPPHLRRLHGKCFSKVFGEYKYSLCPFFNVTQHEQAVRWNTYNGVLGVWREWNIVNNSFVAMTMPGGDSCGDVYRSSQVVFTCGNRTEIVNVSEPQMCTYVIELLTPFVCHPDSMVVFPNMDRELQNHWEELEGLRVNHILTEKGYGKRLRDMFVQAGYQITDKQWQLQATVAEKKDTDVHTDNDGDFDSLYSCRSEYRKLQSTLTELERLLVQHGINWTRVT